MAMTFWQELDDLRAMVKALEAKYETMRLATTALTTTQLEWGNDVENLKRRSVQHLLRIERLEAGATCPHIISSHGGTSYCDLALQTAAAQPASAAAPAPAGGLVERVTEAVNKTTICERDGIARAAIREVAAWLRVESEGHLGSGLHWSRRLEQEADR